MEMLGDCEVASWKCSEERMGGFAMEKVGVGETHALRLSSLTIQAVVN